MHVLHVISSLGNGGAESFLAALAPRLAARGIGQSVVGLTGGGPIADQLEADGISVVRLDARGAAGMVRTVAALRRLVAERRPDVLQGWMYHGDLFATLAHKLTAGGPRRLFWNIRCSDMRLEDYSRQLGLVVRICAWSSRAPDVVLANSEAGAAVHRAAGYRPRQLKVIPNGIDTARFKPDPVARLAVRAELGLPPTAVVALHVARVDPMKDHGSLLTAARSLPGRLQIVLVGKDTRTLSQPPLILGLGRRQDVARLLAAGDIVVSSSAYGEGFSNAVAEGMACGLVPVATAVGDAALIVGNTGLLVPPRDPAALAAALAEAVALSSEERTRRGRLARARIDEHYSIDTAVARFEALYREVQP